jgi:hypothetical protein
MGRDSVVGIVTLYGLGCLWVKSQWDEIFRIVQTSPETHPASYRMGTGYTVFQKELCNFESL